jgi:hydroxymethylglutaryl-CoA reductase
MPAVMNSGETMESEKDKKFYQMSINERQRNVAGQTGLNAEELAAIDGSAGLSLDQADHMIENVAGLYTLPLGVAQNFVVNGRAVQVPMVIEEPSVVAGASFMAKLAKPGGGFTAHTTLPPR